MKQFYFLPLAILISVFSFGQKEGASKLYGYKQKSMPGTVRVDAVGRELPRKPQYNYFIYLASGSKVMPVEVWINGEPYAVTSKTVATTTVEYRNPNSGEDKSQVLVPKTGRIVLQLTPSPQNLQNPGVKGKKLAAKNELVVIYKGGGRLYYKTVPKWSELAPVAMQ